MKQISRILYLSLVLLSISCSKNEIGKGEVETKQHISFAQPQTKSTLLGSSSTLPTLDVIIYETDPDAPALSEDDVVNYLPMSSLSLDGFDNSWRHSPAAPWPVNLDQELTFLAMSPSMPLADNPDYFLELKRVQDEYENYQSDLENYEYYLWHLENEWPWDGEIPTKPIEPTTPMPEPIGNLSINGLAYLPSEQNNYFAFLGEAHGVELGVTSDDFLAAYYKMPADVANHPDLMFSSESANYTSVSALATQSVNLEFHHALTAVSFSVVGEATQKITKITVNNIATSGVGMYFSEFDKSLIEESGIAEDYIMWFPTGEGSVDVLIKDVVPNRDSPTSLTPENGILMVVPSEQRYLRDASITIEYTDGVTPVTQSLFFPNYHEWIPGVHNNYKITLPEALGPMTISVSAIPWNDVEHSISTDSWGPNQGGGGGEGIG